MLAELAARVSPRVLRLPGRTDEVRRELDEYFAGARRRFDLPVDWSLVRGFAQGVLRATARVPFGEVTTYGQMARGGGLAACLAGGRQRAGLEPDPDRGALPPRAARRRRAGWLRRRAGAQALPADARGRRCRAGDLRARRRGPGAPQPDASPAPRRRRRSPPAAAMPRHPGSHAAAVTEEQERGGQDRCRGSSIRPTWMSVARQVDAGPRLDLDEPQDRLGRPARRPAALRRRSSECAAGRAQRAARRAEQRSPPPPTRPAIPQPIEPRAATCASEVDAQVVDGHGRHQRRGGGKRASQRCTSQGAARERRDQPWTGGIGHATTTCRTVSGAADRRPAEQAERQPRPPARG